MAVSLIGGCGQNSILPDRGAVRHSNRLRSPSTPSAGLTSWIRLPAFQRDGCSHQAYADGCAVTIVNFKSYTQTIPDSAGRLFDFSDSQNSNRNLPMKTIDLLLWLLCIAGALAGYLLLEPPLSWYAVAACVALAVWTLFASEAETTTVCGSLGCPGQWKISRAGGSLPDALDRARYSVRLIQSLIRSLKMFRTGWHLPRSKGPLFGNSCKDGRAL